MSFQYRCYREQDLINITPKLYAKDQSKLFYPTQENTIVVLENNHIVAFMDFSHFEDEDIYCIDLFEVFNPRKGIGTRIIKEIQGFEEITCLEVNPYSQQSVKFWDKLGFEFINHETMQWKKG